MICHYINEFNVSEIRTTKSLKMEKSLLIQWFSEEVVGFCEKLRHLCLFFSNVDLFCWNLESPCLRAPRSTPSSTKILVTPIFETWR